MIVSVFAVGRLKHQVGSSRTLCPAASCLRLKGLGFVHSRAEGIAVLQATRSGAGRV
jgi:N12 class adenine-specific DNA methylase